jgi:putative transposase
VERNAVRAGLVTGAEEWQWSSLWRWGRKDAKLLEFLADWPVERPSEWLQWVNEPERESELEALRCGTQRGRPFGIEDWVTTTASRLGLESALRQRGRPKKP